MKNVHNQWMRAQIMCTAMYASYPKMVRIPSCGSTIPIVALATVATHLEFNFKEKKMIQDSTERFCAYFDSVVCAN